MPMLISIYLTVFVICDIHHSETGLIGSVNHGYSTDECSYHTWNHVCAQITPSVHFIFVLQWRFRSSLKMLKHMVREGNTPATLDGVFISRNGQYKDVYRGTIEISQYTQVLRLFAV